MTLILGLIAQNAIVLTSDGQGTAMPGGQPIRMMAEKIFAPWHNMAWGGSGSGPIIQQIGLGLKSSFGSSRHFLAKTRDEIRQEVTDKVAELVRQAHGKVMPVQGLPPQPLISNYLFVGFAVDGSFIFEVHPDLTHSDHTYNGYAAIGSGEIFSYVALAGLKHFEVQNRPLDDAKMVAYRVMEDAIKVAAFGIGPPIQMIEITPISTTPAPTAAQEGTGAATSAATGGIASPVPCVAKKLNDDEMKVLGDSVEQWRLVERDILSQVTGTRREPPATTSANSSSSAANAKEQVPKDTP